MKSDIQKIFTSGNRREQFQSDDERFEAAIQCRCGVVCTVHKTAAKVTVHAADYADWLLARAELRKLTELPVVRG